MMDYLADYFASLSLEDLNLEQQYRLFCLSKNIEEWIANGHGEYSTLSSEKELLDIGKKSKRVVLHCYRSFSRKCTIVDKHLDLLAKKHVETKFCRIEVRKALKLCHRLKICVIPTIILCKEYEIIDYIVGFDDLGGVDDFSTEMMEWRIAKAGVINYDGDLNAPPESATATGKQRPFI